MPDIRVAEVKHDGADLLLAFMNVHFGAADPDTQQAVTAEIQNQAQGARLPGIVIPVWDAGAGRLGFLAPTQWQAYLQTLTLPAVQGMLNRKLLW